MFTWKYANRLYHEHSLSDNRQARAIFTEKCCRTNTSTRLPSACRLSSKLRPSPKFHCTRGLLRHEYEWRNKIRIDVWESIRPQALSLGSILFRRSRLSLFLRSRQWDHRHDHWNLPGVSSLQTSILTFSCNEDFDLTYVMQHRAKSARHQTFKRWIKSHLLFAGIIRSSPFSPR